MNTRLILLSFIGIGLKLLLIPGYFSTDFDVHHNWLRVTHQKPISQWYYDDQSKWTLDYPPFFAYFQYILALIGTFIDPNIIKLVVTPNVLYFQKLSVIAFQVPFLWVLYIIYRRRIGFELIFSYLFLPFIVLDNMHFQYNMMLQTIFLSSLYFLVRKQNYLIAALTYSILLNFKHIYLYCSIAYLSIILKNYVLRSEVTSSSRKQSNMPLPSPFFTGQKLLRLVKVAFITIIPFIISLGPFIALSGVDGIKQMFSRLFPFGRGLIHDYWAPNFWALYYCADKLLAFALKLVLAYQPSILTAEEGAHKALNYLKVLPQPSANFTLLIILISILPLIVVMMRTKRINSLSIVIVNGLVFFMFGYHVHQKAISPYLHLLYVFVTSQVTTDSTNQKNLMRQESNSQFRKLEPESQYDQGQPNGPSRYQQLNKSNRYQRQKINEKKSLIQTQMQLYGLIFFNTLNLYPLLIDVEEKPFKIVTAFVYVSVISLRMRSYQKVKKGLIFYMYLIYSCLAIILICQMVIPYINWLKGNKFQFLPLMINSVTCAFINIIWLAKTYLTTLTKQQPYATLNK